MYVILWQYEVRGRHRAEFEESYGPSGLWVEFFRRADTFITTVLLHDVAGLDRFVTLDFWTDRSAFLRFESDYRDEYRALDNTTTHLTRWEKRIGAFEF